MKKKSDYAFVLACNQGYGFGMIATMNAQNYFGTDADWEVAYDGYTQEERDEISNNQPNNINWTSQNELLKEIKDRRNTPGGMHDQWLTGWVLAHHLLKEKKYKAVCQIQADFLLSVNVDEYFKQAAQGKLVASEVCGYKIHEIKYGDARNGQLFFFGILDGISFIGESDWMLPREFVDFHETIDRYCALPIDIEKVESNPMLRKFIDRVNSGGVIALDGTHWCGDPDYTSAKYYVAGDKLMRRFGNSDKQLCGIHRKWWLIGDVEGMYATSQYLLHTKDKEQIAIWDNIERNINITLDFWRMFRDMTPQIRVVNYVTGYLPRTKYELIGAL